MPDQANNGDCKKLETGDSMETTAVNDECKEIEQNVNQNENNRNGVGKREQKVDDIEKEEYDNVVEESEQDEATVIVEGTCSSVQYFLN